MRDLLHDPACAPEDLGRPIPDSPHACLVCLPTWDSVIGYEEQRPEVIGKLEAGYPRFFLHPEVDKLFRSVERRIGAAGERVVVFPRAEVCERARCFVQRREGVAGRVVEVDGLWALVVPVTAYATARAYWRHTGEVVSSRQAVDYASGRLLGSGPRAGFREAMAEVLEVKPEDCFLFESGMAAIFTAYRILTARRPGRKTLQVCFPYVDALKVQEHFGAGVDFVPRSHGSELQEEIQRVRSGLYAAVFSEVPSNPLLTTPDLEALSEACRSSGTPLVVDDTICSHANLKILPHVDLVTTSLTKWVSGVGDVLAGAVKINPESAVAAELREALQTAAPEGSRLYPADAEVLRHNATGFRRRVELANRHGEQVAEALRGHSAVAAVHYPKFHDRARYDRLRVDGGGYGGLVSFVPAPEVSTPAVYDALRLSKGPSLGTEFSLVSPYTMLAHYEELDWAEACGVAPNLLRLSVGLEDPQVVIAALEEALEAGAERSGPGLAAAEPCGK